MPEGGSRRAYFIEDKLTETKLFISLVMIPQPKPHGLKEMETPFLYGILVKRPELAAAMFTPSRLLLRLGYDMRSKLRL